MSGYVFTIIVGATVVTYLSRIAGFYAGSHDLSDRTQRILAYVPIGAFTAIVTLGFTNSGGESGMRVPAALVAGALAIRKAPLWLCLVLGLAIYGILRVAFE